MYRSQLESMCQSLHYIILRCREQLNNASHTYVIFMKYVIGIGVFNNVLLKLNPSFDCLRSNVTMLYSTILALLINLPLSPTQWCAWC